MKTKFLKAMEKFNRGVVLLQKTTFITEELKEIQPWKDLAEFYLNTKDPVFRAALSILNALYTQKRKYFSLTRRSLEELVKMDANHEGNAGIAHKSYPSVRAFIQDTAQYCKLFASGARGIGKADTFEVVDPEILKFIGDEDLDSQKEQALQFSGVILSQDQTSDQSKDQENRNKNLVSSSQKIETKDQELENENIRFMSLQEIENFFIHFNNEILIAKARKRYHPKANYLTWFETVPSKIKHASKIDLEKIRLGIDEIEKKLGPEYREIFEEVSMILNNSLVPKEPLLPKLTGGSDE